jgi:hypothetical protein
MTRRIVSVIVSQIPAEIWEPLPEVMTILHRRIATAAYVQNLVGDETRAFCGKK